MSENKTKKSKLLDRQETVSINQITADAVTT